MKRLSWYFLWIIFIASCGSHPSYRAAATVPTFKVEAGSAKIVQPTYPEVAIVSVQAGPALVYVLQYGELRAVAVWPGPGGGEVTIPIASVVQGAKPVYIGVTTNETLLREYTGCVGGKGTPPPSNSKPCDQACHECAQDVNADDWCCPSRQ